MPIVTIKMAPYEMGTNRAVQGEGGGGGGSRLAYKEES